LLRLRQRLRKRDDCFVAFAWQCRDGEHLLVAVNYAPNQSQCTCGYRLRTLALARGGCRIKWTMSATTAMAPICNRSGHVYMAGLRLRIDEEVLRPIAQRKVTPMNTEFFNRMILSVILLGTIMLCGCELLVHDAPSLLLPSFKRSEIFGFVAGFGTTFAAVPDLVTMLRRRSSRGMNPTMAAIMGVFQILWVYYGLLIVSRPVIVWNMVAVVINFLSVGAYFRFARSEREPISA
jgi:MtN3 and saliva related transmembrane protein